jgi:regulation of enolase protein 1 (concanavalin A-like superfamily)
MKWLNEPASWQRAGDVLSVSVDPGTDFWRETGYGYFHDSGHVYGEELEGDVDVSVCVRGAFGSQYDQAGIMLRVDERVWLKSGVEFFEGRPRLSTVLTLGRSSWMVTDLPEWMEEISLRASRRGDAVEVRYLVGDGPAELAALVYLPPGRDVLAGVMCAAPEGPGFRVSFRDLRVERGWSVRLAKLAAERREEAAGDAAGSAADHSDDDTLRWSAAAPPDTDPRWAGESASDGATEWALSLPENADARWSGPSEGYGPGWLGDSGSDPAARWYSGSGDAADTGWFGELPGAAGAALADQQHTAPEWSSEPQDALSASWSTDSDGDAPAPESSAEPDHPVRESGETPDDPQPPQSGEDRVDAGALSPSEPWRDAGPLSMGEPWRDAGPPSPGETGDDSGPPSSAALYLASTSLWLGSPLAESAPRSSAETDEYSAAETASESGERLEQSWSGESRDVSEPPRPSGSRDDSEPPRPSGSGDLESSESGELRLDSLPPLPEAPGDQSAASSAGESAHGEPETAAAAEPGEEPPDLARESSDDTTLKWLAELRDDDDPLWPKAPRHDSGPLWPGASRDDSPPAWAARTPTEGFEWPKPRAKDAASDWDRLVAGSRAGTWVPAATPDVGDRWPGPPLLDIAAREREIPDPRPAPPVEAPRNWAQPDGLGSREKPADDRAEPEPPAGEAARREPLPPAPDPADEWISLLTVDPAEE